MIYKWSSYSSFVRDPRLGRSPKLATVFRFLFPFAQTFQKFEHVVYFPKLPPDPFPPISSGVTRTIASCSFFLLLFLCFKQLLHLFKFHVMYPFFLILLSLRTSRKQFLHDVSLSISFPSIELL
ncbi:unnamed protein product [Amoebophrya sp. A120]|nr:unnamed protein product [Amoebophrya sp. A120]|eukprot:GSA120T00002766001.1